jgi:hypothetical protein
VSVLHPLGKVRIDEQPDTDAPPLPTVAVETVATPRGPAARALRVAAANQLELWASGHDCDDFRREYLTDLVTDLRASALDVAANQLDLWSAGKRCEEQRRNSVLDLVAELRSQT